MNHSLSESLSERFLIRSLRMTAALTLLVLLFGWGYFGMWPALAIFSGAVWGIVNILFIRMGIAALLRPGGPDKLTVAGILLVKFPLLYGAGFALLTLENFPPLYLLAGSSLFFVVILLKAIARALFGMDNAPTAETPRRQGILN